MLIFNCAVSFLCLAGTHLDTIVSSTQEETKETKGEKGTTKKDDTEDKALDKEEPAEPKTNDEPVKEDDVSSHLM